MKAKFEKLRGTHLSVEEFKILILSYPIYLVAAADGEFDEAEKELVSTVLTNFLDSVYGENISEEDKTNMVINYLEDFEFLKLNENEFKVPFLESLKSYDQEVISSIRDLIHEVAETSNVVAKSEKDMIDYIISFL
jgi:hypothetical protein